MSIVKYGTNNQGNKENYYCIPCKIRVYVFIKNLIHFSIQSSDQHIFSLNYPNAFEY